MKSKFSVFIYFILFLGFLNAQSSKEKIDEIIQRYVDFNEFSGTVLIAENDQIVFENAYGMANKEWDIPNTIDTKFRIGSVTKQFTSMLIFMLYEQGKIKLDGKLSDYLDYYRKDTGSKITILQLLNHTSGIPSYTNTETFFSETAKLKADPKEFIKKYCSGDLEFEPGTQWVYNNSGYFILGGIIEEITGMAYEQALTKMIFEPLNMKNTGIDNHLEIIKNRANGFARTYIYPTHDDFVDMTTPFSAGAIYSTVNDLYKWDKALYTDKLISNETKKLMLTPVIKNYANGWFVQTMKFDNGDSVTAYWHSGGVNGFNSLIYRIPEKNQTAIALANIIPASVNGIVRGALEIINGDNVELPKASLAQLLAQKLKNDKDFDVYGFYTKLKETEEFDSFQAIERQINQLGYELLRNDLKEKAVEVFKVNVDLFPESFNVYHSMGEAYSALGKKDEAIQNYQKALEINPNLTSSIEALKKLGVEIEVPKDFSLNEEQIEAISGKYELMPNFILTVFKNGDKIMARATGQMAIEIIPESEIMFFNNQIPLKIEFVKNDSGSIESLNLYQNGRTIPGKKID